MVSVGVIGLGDMGSGIARNLIANGFETWGCDLIDARRAAFTAMGGHIAPSTAEVGQNAHFVFVMVMKGADAHEVIFGEGGLVHNMARGGTILLTSTVKPAEARAIGEGLQGTGLLLIDSPVSGGYPGAQSGSLTLMAAAPDKVMSDARPVLEAVSASIHHVGTAPGDGQVVKACLQSLIGSIFSATFEAAALAAKAGVPGQVILDVFSTSSAGSGITNNALEKIIDRQFEGTGSHINTMHKDLTISMALGEELGVPLHTAAAAMQIFNAGRTRHPQGDNWICTKVIEEIVGAELHRDAARVTR